MNEDRTFLVVQWLKLHASTAGGTVQSLVGELRSPQDAWYSQINQSINKRHVLVITSQTELPPWKERCQVE